MKPPANLQSVVGKPHAVLAGEMADAVKEVVHSYANRVPLATAIGVLRIVELELLEEHK